MVSWTPLGSKENERVELGSMPAMDSAEDTVSGEKMGNGWQKRGLVVVSLLMGLAVAWVFFSDAIHHQYGSKQESEFLSLQEISQDDDPLAVAEFDEENLKKPNYDKKNGMWCVGLNAVGFDLHPTARRSMAGDARVPDKEAIRYFFERGSNCFRLAITWERLQLYVGSEDLDAVDGFHDIVEFITKTLGGYVIIDPHNNDEGLQFDAQDVSREDFVNLWIAITKMYGNNDKCIFGLYNEPRFGYEDGTPGYFDPNVLDRDGRVIEFWRQWMQSAIDAIRALGAKNLILVPGLHWTGCADWSGNWWWGETLLEKPNQGNSRLAALTDPENYIAYDVHQYMDGRYTGQEPGCTGHDMNWYCKDSSDCSGADAGLQTTINWAKTYNKKLFMTEIGSWPGNDGTEPICKAKMCNYLQQMHESNVFIGYTVWQFGCDQCDADQWTDRPLNLDWYRIAEFSNLTKCKDSDGGNCAIPTCPAPPPTLFPTLPPLPKPTPASAACSEAGGDCRTSLCCKDESLTCFLKDEYWASCRVTCTPDEIDELGDKWECEALGHAPANVEAAKEVECDVETPCRDSSGSVRDVCKAEARLTCCEKAGKSREACCQLDSIKAVFPGTGMTVHGEDKCHKKCSANWQSCGVSQCCASSGFKCFEKDLTYAQCREANAACPPPEDTEPWSCTMLPAAGSTEVPPLVDLSCSMSSESCKETQCCQDKDKTCYEKNSGWSSCRPTDTCIRGKYAAEFGTDWHTNWTCDWTDKSCTFAVVGNKSRLKANVACPSLGVGWEPVTSEERCRTVRLPGQQTGFNQFRSVDAAQRLARHPTGCSTDLRSSFGIGKWNKNPENQNGCSKWGPCVCQKCE